MMNSGRLKRWTAGWLPTATLVTGVIGGGTASAQQVEATKVPVQNDQFHTKEASFHLPVQMDQRTRDSLKEVCLYVKSGTGDWVRQETSPPAIKSFPYTVPHDGEYWFKLVTVDKLGKAFPPDISKEAPDLRVVVDRRAPVLDVQPCTNQAGDFCLRCTVQDANPDPQSLRVVHVTATGEKSFDPVPGMPGVFRPAGPDMLTWPIRVWAADLSGNMTSRELLIKDLVAIAPPKNPAPGNPVTTTSGHLDQRPPVEPKIVMPPSLLKDLQWPLLPKDAPPILAKDPTPPILAKDLPAAPPLILPGTNDLSLTSFNAPPKQPPVGAVQVLNTTRASLEYRIDQVGLSGIGKVEVYVTIDQGATWKKVAEDHDHRSPAKVDLPGEGLFGVRLAVTNGNGFGGTPPQRGDQPTCWIEVDLTSPFVQLRPIEPVTQNGTLEIRWSATDKNLGPEPVSLFYRIRPEGPWQPIVRNIKNDGSHRWNFPRDAGSQFYLRVEVADQAGNIARADTPNSILLDMTEPRAQVIGVTGVSPR